MASKLYGVVPLPGAHHRTNTFANHIANYSPNNGKEHSETTFQLVVAGPMCVIPHLAMQVPTIRPTTKPTVTPTKVSASTDQWIAASYDH
jgi:hypothetical protein